VNGLAGSRRSSKPVRLTLAGELDGLIDGAWWPHTGMIAAELPDLVGVLHKPLGEIVDIRINWSPSDGNADLQTIVAGVRLQREGDTFRRPRLMAVAGRRATAKLLVVPSMTSPTLGAIVVRAAAGLPTSGGSGDHKLYEMAQLVVGVAKDESIKWNDARRRELNTSSH
jgi:hypothetical protein